MNHEKFDSILQSPLEVVIDDVTLRESRVLREWMNDNATGRWFFVMYSNHLKIKFMEEADMIFFMLVKAELLD